MKRLVNRIAKKIEHLTNNVSEKDRLNSLWSNMEYFINSKDYNSEFLALNKNVQEVEHQVGRFLNMKAIVEEIKINSVPGDFVEFGTWQGNSLIYFARLLNPDYQDRKLVGIDSFEGLPHDSTIWGKGLFSNTELNFVMDNVIKYSPPNLDPKNLLLIKGWFSDEAVRMELQTNVKNVALVHFDADLRSSTETALRLIEPYLLNRNKPMYFLFDDWGCHPDEVPDAFLEWLEEYGKKKFVKATKLTSTRFTRYYKLTF